ncbi:uncharacterized protein [Pyxicephalus adspersus]|uniref:uncharacterized protein n=1 Tax=Pyxicephalus adspersus TaxID=30357 RepID=UPI003B5B9437
MFAVTDNQNQMALPMIQVPPTTPVHMVPAPAPMQMSVQKTMPLQMLHVPPSTPVHMVPATAPMQVPVAVPMAMQTSGHPPAPPAVVTQPQPQTSVVLNMQGGSQMYDRTAMGPYGGPMAFGPISWSSSLLQCCDDIPICLLGCCCSFFFPCYLSSMFGESCCLGVLPGAMFALRTGMRERYRIPGSLLNDYCAVCCCLPCALCQMAREMKGREWRNSRLPMPWRVHDPRTM